MQYKKKKRLWTVYHDSDNHPFFRIAAGYTDSKDKEVGPQANRDY
jgi:hypothetical protein